MNIRKSVLVARKNARDDIRCRQYNNLLKQWSETLATKDSKVIWNKINWKGEQNNVIVEESPDIEDLAKQFMSKDGACKENLLDMDFGTNTVEVLDSKITTDEIENAGKKLKEGKSTADGWTPRMITEISATLYPILMILFNIILQCSLFPDKWWFCVVVALFKKGSRLIPKNYRPVSLVLMLAKLFDFTLLDRFKKWFTPHDLQTAYQEGKSSGDHIFFLRCIIQYLIKMKRKFFITAVDFDGAFDRVKRSTLLKKLILAGASSIFVICLANLYLVSGNTIYSNSNSIIYMLHTGIKQGLPLSPYLFLFYIDDIFGYFDDTFANTCIHVHDRLHILIHADDANLLATTRDMMIQKLKALLVYCKMNSIILQATKCWFTVINGSEEDKHPLQISESESVKYAEYLEILGSHISDKLKNDLQLHFQKRFKNVIKYFNYIRMNKLAPFSVKLKVLKSCVVHTLLYNCEAFGPSTPDGLEEVYFRMLRAALGVRSNCPNLVLLIESGFLPLQCMILARQLNSYRRFQLSIKPDSTHAEMFKHLLHDDNCTSYLKHYVELDQKYPDVKDLFKEQTEKVKSTIRSKGENKEKHYKFWIYLQMNPELTQSPFLHKVDAVGKSMIKFRVGSHNLPIETGIGGIELRVRNDCVPHVVLLETRIMLCMAAV
jgi:hypothetical protein